MICRLCGKENGIPEIPKAIEFTFCVHMRNRHHIAVKCIRLGTDKFRWCADCAVGNPVGYAATDRHGKVVA